MFDNISSITKAARLNTLLAKSTLLICIWPFATVSLAQAKQSSAPASPPKASTSHFVFPETLGANWKIAGQAQTFSATSYQGALDSAVGIEYGLTGVSTCKYSNGKERLSVEAYEMPFPSGAYGFYTFSRSQGKASGGQFLLGRFLLNVQAAPSAKTLAAQFFDSLAQALAFGKTAPPPLVSHLPKRNILPGSEVYFTGPKALAQNKSFGPLANVVSFAGGTEAAAATYQFDQQSIELITFEFHTPQLAADGYDQLESFLKTSSKATQLARIGNYLVVTTGSEDKQLIAQLTGQIKYPTDVYWEGNKFTSIPLEFRPPDPAALDEAMQTANVLLRTFYWIGFMLLLATLLGVIAGSSFFYWRRYQRMKTGEDLLFGDMAETIRLNLESDSSDITDDEQLRRF